jgi:phosphomannomutase
MSASGLKNNLTLEQSLNYQPVELSFGTSGLRGLVKDMTDLECYINTRGFIKFLAETENLRQKSEIVLAGDLRESTPRILAAVIAAIEDSGHTVLNCGYVPTPTAAYLGAIEKKPCVVVTGSHIPADRNGIKYYKASGEVLKPDETLIKRAVAEVRTKIYGEVFKDSRFDENGAMQEAKELPPIDTYAENLYKQRYLGVFPNLPLAKKHIVVYQHSAVGRDMLVEILEKLGAKVTAIGRSKEFMPIDTENITSENKALFEKFAIEHPDNFAIVSTDGDSDRPFVIDEQGTFHRGDILGCVVARYLGADFAAFPISSNDAVDEFCKLEKANFVHTKIGSPYVIEAMQKANQSYKRRVGWEVNGGFLTGTDIKLPGGTLVALPTRDAVLPILCALLTAVESKKKLSTLFDELPRRFTGGGLIEGVPQSKMTHFLETLARNDIPKNQVSNIFTSTDFGNIQKIDTLDGLRVYFDSGKIIHIRPSGNAPQLRIYSNAASQVEADKIVGKSVAPHGLLERFIDQF